MWNRKVHKSVLIRKLNSKKSDGIEPVYRIVYDMLWEKSASRTILAVALVDVPPKNEAKSSQLMRSKPKTTEKSPKNRAVGG